METPTLLVHADQDKIRFGHWVPLAPQLMPALHRFLDGRADDEFLNTSTTSTRDIGEM
ncbi:MAG: hypothetical protein ACXV49_07950 [Halobacteriota archaeon]